MPDAQPSPPAGRYGRSSRSMSGVRDAGTDRGLRILGVVLGVALLAVVGWSGASYVAGSDVTGSLIKYKVVSDDAVEVQLEIRKDPDVAGVCTLRALGRSGGVVGRTDTRVESGEDRVDRVVTVRTTRRATSAELVGCRAVGEG